MHFSFYYKPYLALVVKKTCQIITLISIVVSITKILIATPHTTTPTPTTATQALARYLGGDAFELAREHAPLRPLAQTPDPQAIRRLTLAIADLALEEPVADSLAVQVALGAYGHVHVEELEERVGLARRKVDTELERLVPLDVHLFHYAVFAELVSQIVLCDRIVKIACSVREKLKVGCVF